MLKKYKARIICTSIFTLAVTIWNLIYYYFQYPINYLVDISYTIIIMFVVWWLSGYYDKSAALLEVFNINKQKYEKLFKASIYVLKNVNEVIYKTDRNGNFTLLNPAWEKFTGYTYQESIGKPLLDFIYFEDRQKAIDMTKMHEMNKREQLRILRKDGSYIWVEKNIKVEYDNNGNILSKIGTLSDITDRKKSEEELIQLNQDLSLRSEKLSTVASLSAAVAHEVRNPLTSILGFLQLSKGSKEIKPEYFDIIFSEIERIETVLTELLSLSKPQPITVKPFNLTNTVKVVKTLISSKANMSGIEIIDRQLNEEIWISGDENQIKQVLINLFKNAVEALELTGGKIEVSGKLLSGSAFVYIKDDGPGIPEDILSKLGQPFYSTKEYGTGLGLATSFKIIENHKGKIIISSQVGNGSTFEIMLPLATQKI